MDDRSRESIAIEVDFSLTDVRVIRVLERLAQTRGLPNIITIDNDPEFAGKALDAWPANGGSGTISSAPANR